MVKFGVVIYSLGNFLSGQLRNYKDIGGMIEIKVEKEGQGTAAIDNDSRYRFSPYFYIQANIFVITRSIRLRKQI